MFISAIRAMCCNAASSGSVCLMICYELGIAVHFILAINYQLRLGNPIKFMLSEVEGEQRIGLSISQVLELTTIITSQRAV